MISPESFFAMGFDYGNASSPTQEISEQEEEDIIEFTELNHEISKVLEGQKEMAAAAEKCKETKCRTSNPDSKGNSEVVGRAKCTSGKAKFAKRKGKKRAKKINRKIAHLNFPGQEMLLSPIDPSNVYRNRMISPQMNQYSMNQYRQILSSGGCTYQTPNYVENNFRNQNMSSMTFSPNFSSMSPYDFSSLSMSTGDTPVMGNYANINISPDMMIQNETRGFYSNEYPVGNSCNYVFSPNNNPNDEMILNQMISKKQGKQTNKMSQIQLRNYLGNGAPFIGAVMQNNINVNVIQNNQNPFFSGVGNTNPEQMNTNLIGELKKAKMQNLNKLKNKILTKKDNPLDSLKNSNDIAIHKKEQLDEEHNRINLENILKKKDKRTTLMIRHIPNKYNMVSFLEDINGEFINKYDLFYLPIDYVNNCNLGFAFINFVDPMHIISFFETYRGKKWKRFNSDKICELAYAKFQGKKELISHFEKGSVLNYQQEDKRPLILATPEPLPKVELPLKFLEAFLTIYPYSLYKVVSKDKFVVESFYNF